MVFYSNEGNKSCVHYTHEIFEIIWMKIAGFFSSDLCQWNIHYFIMDYMRWFFLFFFPSVFYETMSTEKFLRFYFYYLIWRIIIIIPTRNFIKHSVLQAELLFFIYGQTHYFGASKHMKNFSVSPVFRVLFHSPTSSLFQSSCFFIIIISFFHAKSLCQL